MNFFSNHPEYKDLIIPEFKKIMLAQYNPLEKKIQKFIGSFDESQKYKSDKKVESKLSEGISILKLENPIAGITDEAMLFAMVSSNVFVMNNRLYAVYHKILERSLGADWSTDRDEFGIAVIDINENFSKNKLEVRYYKFPARFGFKNTGASTDKRYIKFYGIYHKKIIFQIFSPFSDNRGWGTEVFYYSFDAKNNEFKKLSENSVNSFTGSEWIEAKEILLPQLFNPLEQLDQNIINEIKKYILNISDTGEYEGTELIISGKIRENLIILIFRCFSEEEKNCPDEGTGDWICFIKKS